MAEAVQPEGGWSNYLHNLPVRYKGKLDPLILSRSDKS